MIPSYLFVDSPFKVTDFVCNFISSKYINNTVNILLTVFVVVTKIFKKYKLVNLLLFLLYFYVL